MKAIFFDESQTITSIVLDAVANASLEEARATAWSIASRACSTFPMSDEAASHLR